MEAEWAKLLQAADSVMINEKLTNGGGCVRDVHGGDVVPDEITLLNFQSLLSNTAKRSHFADAHAQQSTHNFLTDVLQFSEARCGAEWASFPNVMRELASCLLKPAPTVTFLLA